MSAQMGRPPKEVKKDVGIGLRISKETADKLKYCADTLGVSRTAIIEQGIDLVCQTLKK